jgi:hypothetical protein
MRWCWRGSARIAKTAAGGASIVVLAETLREGMSGRLARRASD